MRTDKALDVTALRTAGRWSSRVPGWVSHLPGRMSRVARSGTTLLGAAVLSAVVLGGWGFVLAPAATAAAPSPEVAYVSTPEG
ncbi:MAG: hypothetical protein ACREX6_00735, partial [Casimicrobiaceae bacterium]